MMSLNDTEVRDLAVLALTCPSCCHEWSDLMDATSRGETYDKEVQVAVSIPRTAFEVLDALITEMRRATVKLEYDENEIEATPSHVLAFMMTKIFVKGLGACLADDAVNPKLLTLFLHMTQKTHPDVAKEPNDDTHKDDNP